MNIPSSINIGLNKQGKQLVDKIDLHFKNHEPEFYDSKVLSTSIEFNGEKEQLLIIKNREFVVSKKESIKSWFDLELYGGVKNLNSNSSASEINVNIILSVFDSSSLIQLKSLLEAIKELEGIQRISGVDVKLFVMLYNIDSQSRVQDVRIGEVLRSIEQVVTDFDSTVREVYYLDDRNVGQVLLNTDENFSVDWLAFAMAEFFVFQMIKERSGAQLNKHRVFGIGVIHFNELLFRSVVSNTILQYKFSQEAVIEDGGVAIRDILNKCNPFIEKHQNFFTQFLEKYPFNAENNQALTTNSKKYIEDFKNEVELFITKEDHNIGESKAILGNLIGENDKMLDGSDWSDNRLDVRDLEYDIIEYFNKFLKENDRVRFKEEKELKSQITQLTQAIKQSEKSIKKIENQSTEILKNINVSFDDGIFSVDGKRINASGYIPSPISTKEDFYSVNNEVIPLAVDLSRYFPKVKDQGPLPSCTAFPITAVYEFFAYRNKKNVDISELFVYYNSRALNGDANEEKGVTLLSAIQAVKERGACQSKTHPYQIDAFKTKPSDEAYTEAQHQIVNKAYRIKIKEKDFKQAIANGIPVIIGLKLFKSFFPQNESGVIPYPSENESRHENHGSHAMLLVGYNDDDKLFKIRNSWGEDFGDNGYCYAPYDYIANTDFCMEAFVITEIVDLSFEEFSYNNEASFSFLSDRLNRRKLIREYDLREKKRMLIKLKNDYDDLAFLNEQNSEKIKDSTFRKSLFNKLKEDSDNNSTLSKPMEEQIVSSNNTPYYFIIGGILLVIISSIISSVITIYGTLSGVIIGLVMLILGVFQMKKKSPIAEEKQVIAVNRFDDKEKYAFEVADKLFEVFDDMNQDLIKRYRAISDYYKKVKIWQAESEKVLKHIEYKSPYFVVNVVKKAPLLNYLEKEKEHFLSKLPNLSNTFHENYSPKEDNVDEVFNDLKNKYLKDIDENVDGILDISMVDYLQQEKQYPYFEEAPYLPDTINKIQKISTPFCNIKETANSLNIQNYVIHEKVISNESRKLKEFSKHRVAQVNPILTFRNSNRKKYVAIQVAALDNVKDLVVYIL